MPSSLTTFCTGLKVGWFSTAVIAILVRRDVDAPAATLVPVAATPVAQSAIVRSMLVIITSLS